MKYLKKGTSLALCTLCLSTTASALDANEVDYYVGLDPNHNAISLRNDWKPVFRGNAYGANAYVGIRPIKYFGAELGYSWTTRKSKTTNVANGAVFASLTNNAGAAVDVNAKLRTVSTYFDLIGYVPIKESFEVFASAGMGWSRMKPTISLSATGNNLDALATLTSKTRSHYRLGLGAQVLVTENLGVRFKATYADVSKQKVTNLTTITLNENIASRMYSFGLGLYLYV